MKRENPEAMGGTSLTHPTLANKKNQRPNSKGVNIAREKGVAVGRDLTLLAAAGLLEGKQVTTHGECADKLRHDYPGLNIDADQIFIRDGQLSTAAGVTAGIDLALALVEEDYGRDIALIVARYMVVFLKRPGGQSRIACAGQRRPKSPGREPPALKTLPHMSEILTCPPWSLPASWIVWTLPFGGRRNCSPRIPQAVMHVLPGTRHLSMLGSPDAVTTLIADFCYT